MAVRAARDKREARAADKVVDIGYSLAVCTVRNKVFRTARLAVCTVRNRVFRTARTAVCTDRKSIPFGIRRKAAHSRLA